MQQEIKERIDMIRRGDIPLGYKRTRVGVIPDNWNVKKIGDISKINLLSLSSDTANDYEFFYYDLSSIDEGKINHPNIKTKYSESPSRARRIFRRNDILMSTVRPNLKGFAKIDFDAEDCVSSTGFAVITVNDEDDFDFLYHNLFGYNIEQQINSLLVGSNYPAINNEDVENLSIPYISIKSEQQKIAAILSTWDKAIELKEQLIAQKQKLKKGLLQRLLVGKERFPGFSEEWKEVKLGDILKERNETGFNNLELLSITSKNGVIKRTEIDGKDNSSEDKSKYKRILPLDIGYNTMRMWQGVSGVSEYEGIVSPAYTVLVPKSTIDSYFIGYLFKHPKIINLFYRFSQGLVNDTLNLKYENLKQIKIKIPKDIIEQRKIAEILSVIDKEIMINEEELALLKQQKKGLMQLLLTGVVRVKY